MNKKGNRPKAERNLSDGFGDLRIGETVTHVFADDPTDLYFGAAFSALIRLQDSKKVHPHFRNSRLQEDVISACVLSFLSLESAINLLFYETFVTNLRTIKSSIPGKLVQHVRRSLNDKGMSIRDKYLLLPPMISDFEFNPGTSPFQLFDEFISFRNGLVHAKQTSKDITIKVTENSSSSLSGEVVDQSIDATYPEQKFPRTKFSTTFATITKTDAEKALEITYRMRMALYEGTLCAPPNLLVDLGAGPFLMATSIGSELCKMFEPHFGSMAFSK